MFRQTCIILAFIAIGAMALPSRRATKHAVKNLKMEKPAKRELAKDFKLIGQQKKKCTYNDQKIAHGTIAYEDVCGKFTCTDGYMAWYYIPNAIAFESCHVPMALVSHDDDDGGTPGMVIDTIPSYSTKSTGEKMERISVIGGPTHGDVSHYSQDEDNHHDPHHALLQTTTIDVKAAHEPNGQPTVEVHDPTTHMGEVSVTDNGGHHGEVITQTKAT